MKFLATLYISMICSDCTVFSVVTYSIRDYIDLYRGPSVEATSKSVRPALRPFEACLADTVQGSSHKQYKDLARETQFYFSIPASVVKMILVGSLWNTVTQKDASP